MGLEEDADPGRLGRHLRLALVDGAEHLRGGRGGGRAVQRGELGLFRPCWPPAFEARLAVDLAFHPSVSISSNHLKALNVSQRKDESAKRKSLGK